MSDPPTHCTSAISQANSGLSQHRRDGAQPAGILTAPHRPTESGTWDPLWPRLGGKEGRPGSMKGQRLEAVNITHQFEGDSAKPRNMSNAYHVSIWKETRIDVPTCPLWKLAFPILLGEDKVGQWLALW